VKNRTPNNNGIRSVHNTRIERVWYDVTSGFGGKWKKFFIDLEANHRLDITKSASIWLLHHLFLPAINEDAARWAKIWNKHKLQIRREPSKSPAEMFYFSILEDGLRGFENEMEAHLDNDQVDDLSVFGIDWEDIDDEVLLQHHRHYNPEDPPDDLEGIPASPFERGPEKFTEVICDPPTGPFDEEEVQWLAEELPRRVDVNTKSMLVRRQVWLEALIICKEIWAACFQ
jgi:hypothetical protein